jgi:hypothetical protein
MIDLEITKAVNSFEPITLEEMETVRLMDRTETKFILPLNSIPGFLNRIPDNYRLLEINQDRIFGYHNVYLDTQDYYFYNQHLTGRLSRNKVRFRKYENSGISYLEVKKRTNRNRVIKYRFESELTTRQNCSDEALAFINEHVPQKNLILKPVLINQFRRITLAGTGSGERITFDFDMSYSDPGGSPVRFPYLAIIEIKRKEPGTRSLLGELLKANYLHPVGFSKYCIGNAVINNPLRQNLLKSRFLMLKKIEYEYIAGSHN